MKGSELRKRYIVIHSPKFSSLLPDLEKNLSRMFRARRKFLNGTYAIFLTNQFQKDQVISYIGENYRDVETLVTSGTIKKCKKFIDLHSEFTGKEEKEISALF